MKPSKLKKALTIYKANKVVEAGYKLSLNEQRVVLACIGQADSRKQLLATDRFELNAKDFAQLFSVSEKSAYQALKEVAEQLFERYVIIDNPDPDDPALKFTKTRWISSINYYPDRGKIALYFAYQMLPYLGQLKGEFTKYNLEYIGKMTCIYAIRLYELLMQWHSTVEREIELDWLKRQFQIEDKYASIKDFKKYVIDPAIADINTHSNLQVSWTQRKTGRRVTHLTFHFQEKTAAEPKPVRRKKPSAAAWRDYLATHARPGESLEQASARLRPQFEAQYC